MRWLALLILMVGMASNAVAGEPDQSFDCTLGTAYSVRVDNESVSTAHPIKFGPNTSPGPWHFRLVKKGPMIDVLWPNSPMQVEGKSSLLQTGKTSFAALSVRRGPCLFTAADCGTLIHFSVQPDKTLKIQLQPIALSSYRDGHEEPFFVIVEGSCGVKEQDK